MTPDPLDDVLDRSAPTVRRADDAQIAAMIASAEAEAAGPLRRRGRLALVGGLLAAVLATGAGVAAATDGFVWGPWLEDPLAEYALTLPSGLGCTVRIAHYTSSDGAVAEDVNRIVEEWWRETDVASEAARIVPAMIDQIRASENTVYIAETGETVPGGFGTEWYDADQEYYFAFSNAIGELERDALGQRGYTADQLGNAGLEGGYGIKCIDDAGQVTIP